MMARIVQLVDDFTEEAGASTHNVSLDGRSVDIDLTDVNFAELENHLAAYFEAGRRVGKSPKTSTKSHKASGDDQDIRAWAREEGLEVNMRGRLSADVREAYEEAHPAKATAAPGTALVGKSDQLAAIRTWARSNGWPDLGPRGRIPGDIIEAFEAAHQGKPSVFSHAS